MRENKSKAYPFLEIDDEDWNYFADKFEYIEYPKGTILLKEGEVENYLTFLEEGIIRTYMMANDKERTLRFTFSDTFVSGYTSFILRKPCRTNIETLTHCKCWRISYDDLQDCYIKTPGGNRMGRISAEFLYILSSSREISLLTKSPEEHYIELMNTNPEWFKQIPLKHVASYLGITPQALSRIRARIA